jgi:hypothetical protein
MPERPQDAAMPEQSQDAAMPEQMQDAAMPEQPVQDAAMPKQPVQDVAMPEQPVQDGAMPEQPVQDAAMPKRPAQENPFDILAAGVRAEAEMRRELEVRYGLGPDLADLLGRGVALDGDMLKLIFQYQVGRPVDNDFCIEYFLLRGKMAALQRSTGVMLRSQQNSSWRPMEIDVKKYMAQNGYPQDQLDFGLRCM